MMWSLYEIIHIWTADVDESEEWSSQLIFQFKPWKEEAWKNPGFNGIRTRDLRDTGAMLSTNWAMKPHVPVEALIFSGFFFPIA